MKNLKFAFLMVFTLSFISCFEDRDDTLISASEINDFVWKGMNAVYLYKGEILDLANDRFSSNEAYATYLNSFYQPEDLFESVIHQRATVDRFSWITNDYIALEQLLSGVSKSNGLKYYSFTAPGSADKILVIRQVIPNSVADDLNLQRGQFITQIDGITLTENNINTLLDQETYTLHFADYNTNGTEDTTDDTFTSNNTTVNLTKVPFTENPVHQTAIIDVDGEKLGYLLYNAFNPNFNNQLNTAFAEFQSNNVQHLVIDLRYNPGGSVNTATLLGSMVTGQFNDQVFSKLVYNSDQQQANTNFNFTNNFDGSAINHLNLSKVYVLTTGLSASASELIINSLRSYIDVIHIGDTTVGKSQASITIYDSPDFSPQNINPSHNYAMQPLVAISINKNDEIVPASGIVPLIPVSENALNLGQFGAVNEPLLAAAIADIQGLGRMSTTLENEVILVKDEDSYNTLKNEMYIDNAFVPSIFKKKIN